MAMASGLYYPTFAAILANTAAIDLSAETYKGMLVTDSYTPNFETHDLYADASSNEVYGTGWAQGGVALTGTTISYDTGKLKFDATDVSAATTTLTNAEGYIWYASPVGGELVVAVDFGGSYSTIAGTFAVTWHTDGVFTIDLVP